MNVPAEKKINYIVYDLETGGFGSDRVAITEIALIAIDGQTLEEFGRYTSFIQPYADLGYDQAAFDATGINMDMVNGGKPAKLVAKEVADFIKACGTGMNKKPVLCGHNIMKFDNPFLDFFLKFHKKDLWSLINKDNMIDTMWWSRMRMPFDQDDFGKHNLNDACAREGIELIDAHRAMNDTAGNAQLLIAHLKHLRGAGESVSRTVNHQFRETFNF